MAISRTPARKSSAPAKKAPAAPAKKAAPAAKKATPPAPVKPVAAKAPVADKVTAHDVLRAAVAVRKAQAEYDRLEAAYWAQNEGELNAAVEHAEKVVAESTPRVRDGRKPADTPSAKARAKTPVIDEFYDKEKTISMSLRDLRELAGELEEKGLITETKVKKTILEQMEEAGLFREEGLADSDEDDFLDDDEDASEDEEDEEIEEEDDSDSDDGESDESDDDDDEDDEAGLTLDDLKAMKLKALQELAEQNSVDWDGLTKSELIDALWNMGEDDEESEDDEEEDDSDEEPEEENEEVEIDLADLPSYSVDELLEISAQIEGLKIPVSKKKDKKFLIQKITEALTPEDEEEDE